MEQSIKEKIAKVYELVKRGGTEGEKAAAKIALDKLMKKHDISEEALSKITLKRYYFKYATQLDLMLFIQLYNYYLPHLEFNAGKSTCGGKNIVCELEYIDYVTIETTYEYFRRHMAKQFREFCLSLVKRCRSTKTKNARRKELQELFFSKYIIASELYNQEQISQINLNNISEKERQDRINLEKSIEGGKFNKQVNTGLYLE
jgi:hypothetical protein